MCRKRTLKLSDEPMPTDPVRETIAASCPASLPTAISLEQQKDAPVEPLERARSVMGAELVGFLDTVVEYVQEEDPGFAQLFADMLYDYIAQLATLSQQTDRQRSGGGGV